MKRNTVVVALLFVALGLTPALAGIKRRAQRTEAPEPVQLERVLKLSYDGQTINLVKPLPENAEQVSLYTKLRMAMADYPGFLEAFAEHFFTKMQNYFPGQFDPYGKPINESHIRTMLTNLMNQELEEMLADYGDQLTLDPVVVRTINTEPSVTRLRQLTGDSTELAASTSSTEDGDLTKIEDCGTCGAGDTPSPECWPICTVGCAFTGTRCAEVEVPGNPGNPASGFCNTTKPAGGFARFAMCGSDEF